jgi:hypothetical protein
MDLEYVIDPLLSSRPLSFDTLIRFQTCYPSHCDPPNCRLYPPSDCLRDGNLVSHFLGTYTCDCGGIPRYLGQTSCHTFQSILEGASMFELHLHR